MGTSRPSYRSHLRAGASKVALGTLLSTTVLVACSRQPEYFPEHVDYGQEVVDDARVHQVLARSTEKAVTRRHTPADNGERKLESFSRTYSVDQIYRSMQGPQSAVTIQLAPGLVKPERVWVTGYHAQVVTPDGKENRSQEFLCHSNLDTFQQYPSLTHGRVPRLFTLSQGQFAVRLPDGFGIPLRSDENLSLWTQLLNLNQSSRGEDIRHKITIDFVRDSEKSREMTPLMMTYANVLVSLDENPECQSDEVLDFAGGGMTCAIGTHAQMDGRTDGVFLDASGRKYSLHWVVKPGKHVYERRMRGLPMLDYDTTIHYIAAHLHPFAEFIEIHDVTENKLLHRAEAVNPADKIGLEKVEDWSGAEGKPLFRDHEYLIRCGYNNTSGEDQDSMAVLLMYCKDRREDPRVSADVRAYLGREGAAPLSQPLPKFLLDESFVPQPTQQHPLLGQAAPDFTLPNQNDSPVSLSQLASRGPVVVVFYYGYFCDHCVAQLYHLNDDVEHFRKLGATVVAISGDTPETTRARMHQNKTFQFSLCYDDGAVARTYGTKVDNHVDLVGQMLHGTFVIGQDGRACWANVGTQPFLDNKTLLREVQKASASQP